MRVGVVVTLKWPEETNFYGLHATRVKINLIIIKLESEIMIWKPNEMEQTVYGEGDRRRKEAERFKDALRDKE